MTKYFGIQITDNKYNDYVKSRHDNFLFDQSYPDFKLIKEDQVDKTFNYAGVLKSFQEINPLMIAFFSKNNVDHIQMLIITGVEALSGVHIGPQSTDELLLVMRSKYITSCKNPLDRSTFKIQICRLNKSVVDWCIPRINENINKYVNYVKDRTNYTTIERSKFISNKGTKINNGFHIRNSL
jgi:hypothetical protein